MTLLDVFYPPGFYPAGFYPPGFLPAEKSIRLLQASISTGGNLITLTFDSPVIGVLASQYALTNGHILAGVSGSTVTRTMGIDPPVIQGELVTLSYVGASTVSAGVPLAPFSGFPVVNNSVIASLGNPDYAGIYAWIRDRLQDTVKTLLDSDFDLAIRSQILHTFSKFPDQVYASLTGDDRLLADQAIGLYCAIRLAVPRQTGGLLAPIVYTNLTMDTNARFTRQTAQISAGNDIDERIRWKTEADEAWGRVSFVAPTLAAAFRPGFGVSLPRRGTVSCHGHRYPGAPRRWR